MLPETGLVWSSSRGDLRVQFSMENRRTLRYRDRLQRLPPRNEGRARIRGARKGEDDWYSAIGAICCSVLLLRRPGLK